MKNSLWRLWYWFRCLPRQFRWRFCKRHQYNVIRLGLPPGYYDPDARLLYAIFGVTSEFVKRTRDAINWASDDGHAAAWAAFTAAAEWWLAHRGLEVDDLTTEDRQEAERLMVGVVKHLGFMWYP